MPSLRRMSGREVVRAFESLGFEAHSRKGSHIKLRRVGPDGNKQTLVVPDHSEIDTGTLRAIVRQASAFVPLDELRPFFFR